MERGDVAVTVKGVVKNFGSTRVLDGVSLEARRGEVVAVVGPNGCGKTTLLRIIAGLEDPDEGHVEVRGKALMVFQENLLLPWKRIRENIALGLVYAKLPRDTVERRVAEAARLLDLEEHLDKYPWQVSGGTARKAAIARVLVLDPDVLLLDEPLAGLDIVTRKALLERVTYVAHGIGKSVIVVDHSIEAVARYADRIYVLSYPPTRVEAAIDLSNVSQRERPKVIYEALMRAASRTYSSS
ncbi:MAG: ATP-binding cassette domain-containing protein [Thermoproteota archaeon]